MDSSAISTEHLTRTFGQLVAVQDVNLRVAPGQFFGFLGPNGAGKSTTIKMLTGLLAPTSGGIEILGLDLAANPVEVKRQIGVVPEGMAPDWRGLRAVDADQPDLQQFRRRRERRPILVRFACAPTRSGSRQEPCAHDHPRVRDGYRLDRSRLDVSYAVARLHGGYRCRRSVRGSH